MTPFRKLYDIVPQEGGANESPRRQPEQSVLCTNCGSRNEVYGTSNRRKNCWYCKEPLIWTNPPQPSPIGQESEAEPDGEIDNILGTFIYDREKETETYIENPNFGKPKHSSSTCQSGLLNEVPEEVRPWPLIGYAPGNYFNRCACCKKDFQGDKRAAMCIECAVSETKRAFNSQQAELSSLRSSLEEKQREIEGLKAERDDYKAALQTICDNSDNSWWTKDEQSLHKIVQEVLDKYPEQK